MKIFWKAALTCTTMSSLVGSVSSQLSVGDVIASYRRSQYLAAEPNYPSSESELFSDEESGAEQDQDLENGVLTPRPVYDGFISQFEWDGLEESGPAENEHTPLIRKVSFASSPHLRYDVPTADLQNRRPVIRRRSSSSIHTKVPGFKGQSTFGQTLFNSVAILVGVGILSVSLAFSYAGWIMGIILITSYGFISCYTAKVLARIILADPRVKSYSDIAYKAFGPKSTIFVAVMFCLELFSVSVVLVTLYADSLNTVWPIYPSNLYKILGLAFLIPTVFFPLSILSYTSILGIVSTLLIMAVVLIDGFSKSDAPGSLIQPAETSFGIQSWHALGVSYGLFMAGLAGHAALPALVKDMVNPLEFEKVIDYAFFIATSMYVVVGVAGYLMFGNMVSEEISMDLLKTPGYNTFLNKIALWMLVISPLTKFALTTHPLNTTLDILFSNDPESTKKSVLLARILRVGQRLLVTLLSVVVSIVVPEFSSMMAFLGSFSAFMICVIGPLAAKIALENHCSTFDGLTLSIGIVMAVWGTTVAFIY